MDDRDRVMRLVLTRELIVHALNGHIRVRSLDLPPDVCVVDVGYDVARRGFIVLLHSQAFAMAPLGEEPPLLPPLRLETIERCD